MAYQRTRKDTEKRTVEAGRIPLHPDHPLLLIRKGVREIAETISAETWNQNPAAPLLQGKDFYKKTLPMTKGPGLNAVWAEAGRLLAEPALKENHIRRARHLFGLLKNLDQKKDGVLVNVPSHLREGLDKRAFRVVCGRLKEAEWDEVMSLASGAFCGQEQDPLMSELLVSVCQAANEKFTRPTWIGERAERAKVRINLDARSVRGGVDTLAACLDALNMGLVAGVEGRVNLHVSGHKPRHAGIPLRVRLLPVLSNRYGTGSFVGSLAVSIGPDEAVIQAVIETRPPAPKETVRYVKGGDFGYKNTFSSVLIDLGKEVSVKTARRVAASVSASDSKACKFYLTERTLPDGIRIVSTKTYSGDGFMRRMKESDERIETLLREINHNYKRLRMLKEEYARGIGSDLADLVPEECPEHASALTTKHHVRFWRVLGVIKRLKEKKLTLFKRASDIKDSWFGFILNREMEEAAHHGALLVTEDLTVEAIKRTDPKHKGRAFNKMINHGAKGRFFRKTEDKARMSGVPLVKVPSRHTSTSDVRNGVVDAKQRNGLVFTARTDNRRFHADLFASFTIGMWPFLVKTKKRVTTRFEPDLSALAAVFG